MPKVNLKIACKTCGSEERVFPCPSCARYTCRECLLVMDEEGCVHKKHEPIKSQTWNEPHWES